jgi:hypothetical protein
MHEIPIQGSGRPAWRVEIVRAARWLPQLVEAFGTGDAPPPLPWAPEGRAEYNRAVAEQAGVSDRVTFAVTDASAPGLSGRFDLVTIFEVLHDMSRPVDALRTARGACPRSWATPARPPPGR